MLGLRRAGFRLLKMPIFRLSREPVFPMPHLAEPDGLLAVGGDLSCLRLISAYLQGIFPWYGPGDPLLWWSPDPRLVLLPEELHVPRSLRKVLNSGRFSCSMNMAFGRVIRHCAESDRPGGQGTWLVPEMIQAYEVLHELGLAVSVETWLDEDLAGGFYGVALGRAFFGESMFYLFPDASKTALVCFVRSCGSALDFIDCQQKTEHMVRFGARELDRSDFQTLLGRAVQGFQSPEALSFWSRKFFFPSRNLPENKE
jgi:leucyl/phenylalanyl-tRNA--protein transferase